jgi:very-short-patch-repair endonuclease
MPRSELTDRIPYDKRRMAYLEGPGLTVLRYPNREVAESLDGVCDAIFAACGGETPHPPLSPQSGARVSR